MGESLARVRSSKEVSMAGMRREKRNGEVRSDREQGQIMLGLRGSLYSFGCYSMKKKFKNSERMNESDLTYVLKDLLWQGRLELSRITGR